MRESQLTDLAIWRQFLDQLPDAARSYLERIEDLTEIPFSIISVGPGRDQTIVLRDLF